MGTPDDHAIQSAVVEETPAVLGAGEIQLKHPPAGLIWLDFQFLSADAPPQVVGHTPQDQPTVRGNVSCQNVIRNTHDTAGGEAVFAESPDDLVALVRNPDGGESETRLSTRAE